MPTSEWEPHYDGTDCTDKQHFIAWSDTMIQENPPEGTTCKCGRIKADGKGGYVNADK